MAPQQSVAIVLSEAALDLFSEQEATHHRQYAEEVQLTVPHLEALAITTRDVATQVHNGLAECKRIATHIDMVRRAQVDPLNAQVKTINDAWRPLTDALASVEKVCKRKLLAFNQAEAERVAREQAEARRRQEEAARKEQDALAKAAAAKSSRVREAALEKAAVAGQELAQARMAEPMDAPTAFRTDHGTTTTRYRWTFRIEAPDEIPHRYLMPDEKAIRRAVADGVRQIPGVVIYEEAEIAVRT
jgi:hypothetical protein